MKHVYIVVAEEAEVVGVYSRPNIAIRALYDRGDFDVVTPGMLSKASRQLQDTGFVPLYDDKDGYYYAARRPVVTSYPSRASLM